MIKITYEIFSSGRSFETNFHEAYLNEVKTIVENKLKYIEGIENESIVIEFNSKTGNLDIKNASSPEMEAKMNEALR